MSFWDEVFNTAPPGPPSPAQLITTAAETVENWRQLTPGEQLAVLRRIYEQQCGLVTPNVYAALYTTVFPLEKKAPR